MKSATGFLVFVAGIFIGVAFTVMVMLAAALGK